ncbi:hypothetical protein BDW62DRAFT_53964 [Aspergillus aurantiobrunneus]
MSATGRSKPEGLLGLTQSEARLILLGFLYTDDSGKIDFEKLAAHAPYKNAQSASSSYRQAKKRFYDQNSKYLDCPAMGAGGNPGPFNAPTKKSPSKRKRAPAAIDTDAGNEYGVALAEDQCSASSTPVQKAQRKSSAKKEVVVKTEAESAQYIEMVPPNQPDLHNVIKSEDGDIRMNNLTRTDEEEIMTELNVDAEFEAMEGNGESAEAAAGGA